MGNEQTSPCSKTLTKDSKTFLTRDEMKINYLTQTKIEINKHKKINLSETDINYNNKREEVIEHFDKINLYYTDYYKIEKSELKNHMTKNYNLTLNKLVGNIICEICNYSNKKFLCGNLIFNLPIALEKEFLTSNLKEKNKSSSFSTIRTNPIRSEDDFVKLKQNLFTEIDLLSEEIFNNEFTEIDESCLGEFDEKENEEGILSQIYQSKYEASSHKNSSIFTQLKTEKNKLTNPLINKLKPLNIRIDIRPLVRSRSPEYIKTKLYNVDKYEENNLSQTLNHKMKNVDIKTLICSTNCSINKTKSTIKNV